MKSGLGLQKKLFLGLFSLFLFLSNSSIAQNSSITRLHPQHEKILHKWLSQMPDLRLATEADCNCADDIIATRTTTVGVWKAIPDYTPYYASGDFNSDGQIDFAVALIDKTKFTNRFAIAIFNGPFQLHKNYKPVLFEKTLNFVAKGFPLGRQAPGRFV